MQRPGLPVESGHTWREGGLQAEDLSPVMLSTDPRISNAVALAEEGWAEAQDTAVRILSDTLVLKPCTRSECDIFHLAGPELALPLLATVGHIHEDMTRFAHDAAIFTRGNPLVLSAIQPQDRRPLSLQIAELVSRLHARGIVHGDIHPEVLQRNADGRLVFGDFSNARLAGRTFSRSRLSWNGNGGFLSPQLLGNTKPGHCVLPTESDDLYAAAVTVWCIWAGRYPEPGMFSGNGGPIPDLRVVGDPDIFGDVVEALQQGGLNLDIILEKSLVRGRELSPPLLTRSDPGAERAPTPEVGSSRGSQSTAENSPPVELPAEVPPATLAGPPSLQCEPVNAHKDGAEPCRRGFDPMLDPKHSALTKSPLTVDTRLASVPSLNRNSLPKDANSASRSSSDGDDGGDDDDFDDDNDSTTSSDSLDSDLVTWEFPFPFHQGLPCSPTDSVVCVASPKGPPPPGFAVCISPDQLLRIQHRRVQSVISMSARLEKGGSDALDNVKDVGRRWRAVSRARATRSLSRCEQLRVEGGGRHSWGN